MESPKTHGLKRRMAVSVAVAALVLGLSLVAVEIFRPPVPWAASAFSSGVVVAVALCVVVPIVLIFLVPFLLGSGTIRPVSGRWTAAEGIAERLRARGLDCRTEAVEGGVKYVGTNAMPNLIDPTPGRKRAREIEVLARGVEAEAAFRYLATDAVGVDTGETDYARAELEHVVRGTFAPDDVMLRGWAVSFFMHVLGITAALLLIRTGVLAPTVAVASLFCGGAFILGSLLQGIRELRRGRPYLECGLILLAACAVTALRAFLS